jgi:hypothetical protein
MSLAWLSDRPLGSDGLCLKIWDGPDADQAEAEGYTVDEPCWKPAGHTGRHTWEPDPREDY